MILKASLVALTSAFLISCGVGGEALKNNCTLTSDGGCIYTCKDGSYSDPRARSSVCLPCQKCCNDGEDKIAVECADYPNKCQVRSPCSTWNTMPPNTTTASQESSTATDLQRTQQPAPFTTKTTAARTVRTKTVSIAPPTSSGNKPYKEEIINNIYNESKNSNGSMALFIPFIIIAVAIAFLVVFLVVFLVWDKLKPRCNPARNDDVDITSPNLELSSFEMQPASVSTSQEQLNQGNITLEELEHQHLEALEWMCTRLDNGQRQDFEWLASKYPRITLDQRRSLQNEFKNSGGSPSKALVKHLQVLYPNLTVRDFLRSLTEIRRNDIARGLQQRIIDNEIGSTVV